MNNANADARVYTADEVQAELCNARSKGWTSGEPIVFRNHPEHGQLLARVKGHPESEILVVYSTRPGFQFPVDVPGTRRYQRAYDFDALYLLLDFFCREKLQQAEADKVKSADLIVVDVKFVGNCRKVLTFNRELSDAEFDAYGRMERLQPYISPCGYVLRKAPNAFLVDESTD